MICTFYLVAEISDTSNSRAFGAVVDYDISLSCCDADRINVAETRKGTRIITSHLVSSTSAYYYCPL